MLGSEVTPLTGVIVMVGSEVAPICVLGSEVAPKSALGSEVAPKDAAISEVAPKPSRPPVKSDDKSTQKPNK